MRRNCFLTRGLALSLAFCYFTTQVALGSTAESNLWTERRRNRENRSPSPATPLVASASLPFAPPATSASVLKQLPAVASTLPGESAWAAKNEKRFGSLPPQLKSLLQSIPLASSSIQEVYDGGSNVAPPVLLVQDVHLNPEAQGNIASVLQELINQKQAGLVAVEGAFSRFDFEPFRQITTADLRDLVARDFLKQNLIGAPSYVGIASPAETPPMIGVDDKEHYQANVQAYLQSRALKKKVTKEISDLERRLSEEKRKLFSPEMNRFDALRQAHDKGEMGLGAYLQQITDSDSFVIDQFLEAYEMERSLDFARVERERRAVIDKLAPLMSEKEMADLVGASLAYRMGRLSFGAYYENLKELCERKGVRLSETPAFNSYIQYVLLSDGIKAEALFSAIDKLEQRLVSQLAKTPEEKSLAAESEYLSLVQKLVEFSLTPQEWGKYKEFSSSRTSPPQAGAIRDPENHVDDLDPGPPQDGSAGADFRRDDDFVSFERFYEQADLRSRKMVENLFLARPSTVDDRPSVVVAGGFHTPHIAQLLRERKISYVVVSPKITKIEDSSGSAYLSVFAQEKTPLDRLFAGEKLFIQPPHLAIGTGSAPKTEAALRVCEASNSLQGRPQTMAGVKFTSKGDHRFHAKTDGAESFEFDGGYGTPAPPHAIQGGNTWLISATPSLRQRVWSLAERAVNVFRRLVVPLSIIVLLWIVRHAGAEPVAKTGEWVANLPFRPPLLATIPLGVIAALILMAIVVSVAIIYLILKRWVNGSPPRPHEEPQPRRIESIEDRPPKEPPVGDLINDDDPALLEFKLWLETVKDDLRPDVIKLVRATIKRQSRWLYLTLFPDLTNDEIKAYLQLMRNQPRGAWALREFMRRKRLSKEFVKNQFRNPVKDAPLIPPVALLTSVVVGFILRSPRKPPYVMGDQRRILTEACDALNKKITELFLTESAQNPTHLTQGEADQQADSMVEEIVAEQADESSTSATVGIEALRYDVPPEAIRDRVNRVIESRNGASSIEFEIEKHKRGVRVDPVPKGLARELNGKEMNTFAQIPTTVGCALEILLTDDPAERESILRRAKHIRLTRATAYHKFSEIHADSILRISNGAPYLSKKAREFFVNHTDILKKYVDGDLIRDVIRTLGMKYYGDINLTRSIGTYLEAVYRFEQPTNVQEIKATLSELMRMSYHFAKAVGFGGEKVYSASKKQWFYTEPEPISKLGAKQDFKVVPANVANTPEEFMKFVRQQIDVSPLYIFNQAFQFDSRIFLLVARNGHLEIFYTSYQFSTVAGRIDQWMRQEEVHMYEDDQGKLIFNWFAKPGGSDVGHQLTDDANFKLFALLKRNKEIEILPESDSNTQKLANLHVDLGLAVSWRGERMIRDKKGKLQEQNDIGLQVQRGRFPGYELWTMMLEEQPLPPRSSQIQRIPQAQLLTMMGNNSTATSPQATMAASLIKGPPSYTILGAPAWEWIFQVPALAAFTLGPATSPVVWLALIFLAVIFSAPFASFHRGRSPPQRWVLFLLSLGFTAALVFPALLFGPSFDSIAAGLLFNYVFHAGYNFFVLAILPHLPYAATLQEWLSVASVPGGEDASLESFFRNLQIGKIYVHQGYGFVRVLTILPDERAVVVKRLSFWGSFTPSRIGPESYSHSHERREDTTKLLNVKPSDLVLYDSKDGPAALRRRSNRVIPERYVPIFFGLNAICARLDTEQANAVKEICLKEFPDIDFKDGAWELIAVQKLTENGFRRFGELFKRIYFETGEDMIVTGALDSYGREFEEGTPKLVWQAWYYLPFSRKRSKWPRLQGVYADVSSYYREWLLRNGLKAMNTKNNVVITPQEYTEVHDRFYLYLAHYFPKKDPRHKIDFFSQLILGQKRDFSSTGHIYALVETRMKELTASSLSNVDLVVPAPSMSPATNQTIPLSLLVSRELNRPVSLTAVEQVRKRKKQKQLSKIERRAFNAGGVFQGNPEELEGKVVLIVDDNETTGFTAAAMMAAAYQAGAKKVFVLSYGRTARRRNLVPVGEPESLATPARLTAGDVAVAILSSTLPNPLKVPVLEKIPESEADRPDLLETIVDALKNASDQASTLKLMEYFNPRSQSLSDQQRSYLKKVVVAAIKQMPQEGSSHRTKRQKEYYDTIFGLAPKLRLDIRAEVPVLLQRINVGNKAERRIWENYFETLSDIVLQDVGVAQEALGIYANNLDLDYSTQLSPVVRAVSLKAIRRIAGQIDEGHVSPQGVDLNHVVAALERTRSKHGKKLDAPLVADLDKSIALLKKQIPPEPGGPASILDPLWELVAWAKPTWANTRLYGWLYVIYTIVGAAILETWGFQAWLNSSSGPVAILAVAVLFAAAHFIVKWLVNAWKKSRSKPAVSFWSAFRDEAVNSLHADKSKFTILILLSLIFSLPFLQFSFIPALLNDHPFWAAAILHGFYNATVLTAQAGWFGATVKTWAEKLPLATIGWFDWLPWGQQVTEDEVLEQRGWLVDLITDEPQILESYHFDTMGSFEQFFLRRAKNDRRRWRAAKGDVAKIFGLFKKKDNWSVQELQTAALETLGVALYTPGRKDDDFTRFIKKIEDGTIPFSVVLDRGKPAIKVALDFGSGPVFLSLYLEWRKRILQIEELGHDLDQSLVVGIAKGLMEDPEQQGKKELKNHILHKFRDKQKEVSDIISLFSERIFAGITLSGQGSEMWEVIYSKDIARHHGYGQAFVTLVDALSQKIQGKNEAEMLDAVLEAIGETREKDLGREIYEQWLKEEKIRSDWKRRREEKRPQASLTAKPSLDWCYELFNIPRTASEKEIEEAYQKFSWENHPNQNPEDPTAANRWKEGNKAYALLRQQFEEGKGGLILPLKRGVLALAERWLPTRMFRFVSRTYDLIVGVGLENYILGGIFYGLTYVLVAQGILSPEANLWAWWIFFVGLHLLNFIKSWTGERSPPAWGNLFAALLIAALNITFGLSPLDPLSLLVHFSVNLLFFGVRWVFLTLHRWLEARRFQSVDRLASLMKKQADQFLEDLADEKKFDDVFSWPFPADNDHWDFSFIGVVPGRTSNDPHIFIVPDWLNAYLDPDSTPESAHYYKPEPGHDPQHGFRLAPLPPRLRSTLMRLMNPDQNSKGHIVIPESRLKIDPTEDEQHLERLIFHERLHAFLTPDPTTSLYKRMKQLLETTLKHVDEELKNDGYALSVRPSEALVRLAEDAVFGDPAQWLELHSLFNPEDFKTLMELIDKAGPDRNTIPELVKRVKEEYQRKASNFNRIPISGPYRIYSQEESLGLLREIARRFPRLSLQKFMDAPWTSATGVIEKIEAGEMLLLETPDQVSFVPAWFGPTHGFVTDPLKVDKARPLGPASEGSTGGISDEQAPRGTASILEPLWGLIAWAKPSWANTRLYSWLYVIYTIVGAAILETAGFQAWLNSSSGPVAILAVAALFAAAHFIIKWLVNAWKRSRSEPAVSFWSAFRDEVLNSLHTDKSKFAILILLSLVFSLPFLQFSFMPALLNDHPFWAAAILHGLYNAFILAAQAGWFGTRIKKGAEKLPLAAIRSESVTRKTLPEVPEDVAVFALPTLIQAVKKVAPGQDPKENLYFAYLGLAYFYKLYKKEKSGSSEELNPFDDEKFKPRLYRYVVRTVDARLQNERRWKWQRERPLSDLSPADYDEARILEGPIEDNIVPHPRLSIRRLASIRAVSQLMARGKDAMNLRETFPLLLDHSLRAFKPKTREKLRAMFLDHLQGYTNRDLSWKYKLKEQSVGKYLQLIRAGMRKELDQRPDIYGLHKDRRGTLEPKSESALENSDDTGGTGGISEMARILFTRLFPSLVGNYDRVHAFRFENFLVSFLIVGVSGFSWAMGWGWNLPLANFLGWAVFFGVHGAEFFLLQSPHVRSLIQRMTGVQVRAPPLANVGFAALLFLPNAAPWLLSFLPIDSLYPFLVPLTAVIFILSWPAHFLMNRGTFYVVIDRFNENSEERRLVRKRLEQTLKDIAQDPEDNIIHRTWIRNWLSSQGIFSAAEIESLTPLLADWTPKGGGIFSHEGALAVYPPSETVKQELNQAINPPTLDKFNALIAIGHDWHAKYTLRLPFPNEQASSEKINLVRELVKHLPSGFLSFGRHVKGLEGGIIVDASRRDNISEERGSFDDENHQLRILDEGFWTWRAYIETFFHELGHSRQTPHITESSRLYRLLFEALQKNDVYALPALGEDGATRRAYLTGHFLDGQVLELAITETFAECFMHYILHGDLMAAGFPGYVRDTQLWKEIYVYYRDHVFFGKEYRSLEPQPHTNLQSKKPFSAGGTMDGVRARFLRRPEILFTLATAAALVFPSVVWGAVEGVAAIAHGGAGVWLGSTATVLIAFTVIGVMGIVKINKRRQRSRDEDRAAERLRRFVNGPGETVPMDTSPAAEERSLDPHDDLEIGLSLNALDEPRLVLVHHSLMVLSDKYRTTAEQMAQRLELPLTDRIVVARTWAAVYQNPANFPMTMRPSFLGVGTRLAKYKTSDRGRVGKGGFGAVYEATNGKNSVIVKTIRIQPEDTLKDLIQVMVALANESRLLERVEERTARRISPRAFSFGYDPATHHLYLVMEKIEGETLDPANPMQWDHLLDLIGLLKDLHQAGFIHNDIKPNNFMIDKQGRLWLIDFGMAVDLQIRDEAGSRKQQRGDLIKTRLYLAPERYHESSLATDKSDIYSLGITLFQLLSQDFLRRPDVGAILMRMIDPDPESRPSAAEVKSLFANLPETYEGKRLPENPFLFRDYVDKFSETTNQQGNLRLVAYNHFSAYYRRPLLEKIAGLLQGALNVSRLRWAGALGALLVLATPARGEVFSLAAPLAKAVVAAQNQPLLPPWVGGILSVLVVVGLLVLAALVMVRARKKKVTQIDDAEPRLHSMMWRIAHRSEQKEIEQFLWRTGSEPVDELLNHLEKKVNRAIQTEDVLVLLTLKALNVRKRGLVREMLHEGTPGKLPYSAQEVHAQERRISSLLARYRDVFAARGVTAVSELWDRYQYMATYADRENERFLWFFVFGTALPDLGGLDRGASSPTTLADFIGQVANRVDPRMAKPIVQLLVASMTFFHGEFPVQSGGLGQEAIASEILTDTIHSSPSPTNARRQEERQQFGAALARVNEQLEGRYEFVRRTWPDDAEVNLVKVGLARRLAIASLHYASAILQFFQGQRVSVLLALSLLPLSIVLSYAADSQESAMAFAFVGVLLFRPPRFGARERALHETLQLAQAIRADRWGDVVKLIAPAEALDVDSVERGRSVQGRTSSLPWDDLLNDANFLDQLDEALQRDGVQLSEDQQEVFAVILAAHGMKSSRLPLRPALDLAGSKTFVLKGEGITDEVVWAGLMRMGFTNSTLLVEEASLRRLATRAALEKAGVRVAGFNGSTRKLLNPAGVIDPDAFERLTLQPLNSTFLILSNGISAPLGLSVQSILLDDLVPPAERQNIQELKEIIRRRLTAA